MDRQVAMLMLLGLLVSVILLLLALISVAPIFWSCTISLCYTLFSIMLNESHEVHTGQENENRFWTIAAVLFSTALFFAVDSPIAIGQWDPSLGFFSVLMAGYAMHVWDRNNHRLEVGRLVRLKRGTATSSLNKLQDLGIPIEEQLNHLDECLRDIDQTFIPSTINNWINRANVFRKEREIISVFEEAEPGSLNYLVCNSRLSLIFYKIKDHNFKHPHRTQIIELLSIERIAHLNVYSRVILLHALQMLKLSANIKAEHCVRNIILSTVQDDLSELKTLSDAKGDYLSFVKLVYDDIKSEIVRDEILKHIHNQAKVQKQHMLFKTKRSRDRKRKFWRKVLSDVDDTLTCSGGSYPSGVDKRYGKKVVYPGVLGFYRELDLGIDGPPEWPDHTVGNLVFLSARPHVYKDISEKMNFAKFKRLQAKGMHTSPSLLAGDINSGLETVLKNDFEPLAQKKFKNFKQYVSIYPEFRHVFICDNGQGDVRAAELMVDAYPEEVEAIYVHEVLPRSKTYKYNPEFWKSRAVKPFFFRTYIDAALDAATRKPPLLQIGGLRRICVEARRQFYEIETKNWPTEKHKWDRFDELNQSLYYANRFLNFIGVNKVDLLEADRVWKDNQKVRTPYGIGTIVGFDATQDLYEVILDWRPIVMQIQDAIDIQADQKRKRITNSSKNKDVDQESQKKLDIVQTEEEVMQVTGQNTSQSNENAGGRPSKPSPSNILPVSTSNYGPFSMDTLPTLEDEIIESEKKHIVTAKIKARFITPYTPPNLPILPKEKSTFSFWTVPTLVKPKPLFRRNDKCSTPFGFGVVINYRSDCGIVVVALSGWNATCYLNSDAVKPLSEGFFNKFLKKMSSETNVSHTQQDKRHLEFLQKMDSVVSTPYGKGTLVLPEDDKRLRALGTHRHENDNSVDEIYTVAIELTEWPSANGTKPILYCTHSSMSQWNNRSSDSSKLQSELSLLSAFGSLAQNVKSIMKYKFDNTIGTKPIEGAHTFDQFYSDGATVVTQFGDGVVDKFRSSDGVYQISLLEWKLCDGKNAKMFTMQSSLASKIASGCTEGCPVLTSLGLSGTLVSVRKKSGLHIVSVPATHMVCYLLPNDIVRPLNACVLESVLTPFGEGIIAKYRYRDDIYEINMKWNGKMYCKADSFIRKDVAKVEKTV